MQNRQKERLNRFRQLKDEFVSDSREVFSRLKSGFREDFESLKRQSRKLSVDDVAEEFRKDAAFGKEVMRYSKVNFLLV